MKDQLHERGKALEGDFFRQLDQKLLAKLRTELEAQEQKDALRSASGIDDDETLDKLIQLDISAEALTSFALVPLVVIAWADGTVQNNERDAILRAAAESGIVSDSPGYELLQSWLNSSPGSSLLDSWKSYIASLKTSLDEAAFNQLKNKVIGRARSVAEAAGGFLGMGSVSTAEANLLEEMENAF